MMISSSLSVLLLLVPLVSALAIQRRSTSICGQYESTSWGSYTLFNNLWGGAGATYGWQCSSLDYVGDTASWHTNYDWNGGTGIKSFSNLQLNFGNNRRLDGISSMPSVWNWYQSNFDGVEMDVTYDFFTTNGYELMVWLCNTNAGPIASYDSNGNPISAATNIDITGYTWNMYSGYNGGNVVYSFLPAGSCITSFQGDMYNFYQYLMDNNYISSSQYLSVAQAGIEVTYGSATFTTSSYSLSIN